ncbi:MAG: phosphoadenosine phosphosulfate reductase family protein [Dysgonomonas sp.]
MNRKVNQAIDFLKSIENDKPLVLGFSGGKDSVVLLDLAERSGIKYTAIHSVTTVDPPGTISFIKKNYPQVVIERPEKTFFQLVSEKGTPGRLKRFCCEELKEKGGIGKRFIDGSRAEESSKRSHYEPEQCDTRKFMKGCIHYYAILYWLTNEVWKYIQNNRLPYIKYYDSPYNLKRHGCVGCPLAGCEQMRYEYKLFPKYALAMIKALEKYLNTHPLTVAANVFDNEYEAFYSYLTEISISDFKQLKRNLFGFNAKNIIEKEILNN